MTTELSLHSGYFSTQPDPILEFIMQFLLDPRNQKRLTSPYGHLSLEGQRYGGELCFMSYLTSKSHNHKREFCPMAHTLKQAEINQTRIAEPPLKTLFQVRRVCKRFYFIVNKIVWNIDPASVVKLYIAIAITRHEDEVFSIKRELKKSMTHTAIEANTQPIEENVTEPREPSTQMAMETDTSSEEKCSEANYSVRNIFDVKMPYRVCDNTQGIVPSLSKLTDFVWEVAMKLKIVRTFQDLVLFQRCEDEYDFPELDEELHRFMLNLEVTAIAKGHVEMFTLSIPNAHERILLEFQFSHDFTVLGGKLTFIDTMTNQQDTHLFLNRDAITSTHVFAIMKEKMQTILSEQELLLFTLAMLRDFEHGQKIWRTQNTGNHPVTCRIRVHRNRMELPRKQLEIESNATLEELKRRVVDLVQDESKLPYYFRFRKVSHRKNHTKRPNTLYEPADYEKPLEELNLRKKQHIYLEQDTSANFEGLDNFGPITGGDNSRILISVRIWNEQLKKPTSLRDFVVLQSITVGQLKKLLSDYASIPPEKMVLVEEETEKQIHLLVDDTKQLSNYGIVTGDVLHIEPLCKEHFGEDGKVVNSLVQKYFISQNRQYRVPFGELFGSIPPIDVDALSDQVIDYFKRLFASPKWLSPSISFLLFETFYYLIRVFLRIKAIACINSRESTKKEEAHLLLRNTKFEQIWHENSTRVSVKCILRDTPIDLFAKLGKMEKEEDQGDDAVDFSSIERPLKRRKIVSSPVGEIPSSNAGEIPSSRLGDNMIPFPKANSHPVNLKASTGSLPRFIRDSASSITFNETGNIIAPNDLHRDQSGLDSLVAAALMTDQLDTSGIPHPQPENRNANEASEANPPFVYITGETKEEPVTSNEPPPETVFVRLAQGVFRYAEQKLQFPDKDLDAEGWKKVINILETYLTPEELQAFFQDVLVELNRVDCFGKLKDVYNDSVWSLYPYGDHTQFKYSPNI